MQKHLTEIRWGVIFTAMMLLWMWAEQLVGLHGQFEAMAQAAPAGQAPPDVGAFLIGIGVFTLLYSLGISAVQAWIIKRLMAPEVVAEFRG